MPPKPQAADDRRGRRQAHYHSFQRVIRTRDPSIFFPRIRVGGDEGDCYGCAPGGIADERVVFNYSWRKAEILGEEMKGRGGGNLGTG